MSIAGWSPELAMDAYLHTLQLCKEQQDDASGSGVVMEPRSMEYIAALAAGNQARHLLDVASSAGASSSSSPATAVALAIAAARTGGRLVCVRDDQPSLDGVRRNLRHLGLATSAVDFQLARPPSTEVAVRRLRRVDFAVVDAGVERCREVLGAVDVDPMGAIVVVTNVFQEETTSSSSSSGHGGGSRVCSYGQVVGKGKSMVLPIGHGMEVTKLGRVGGLSGAHLQWQRQHKQKKKLVISTPKRTFLVCDGSS